LAIAAGLGTGNALSVFGDDFDTPDGTCVRDYIHVCDLAEAHVKAIEIELHAGAFEALNVGAGRGHSVFEVVDEVSRAIGNRVPYSVGPRRFGDPPSLVADPARARDLLGWSASRSSLEQIVSDAVRWQRGAAYGVGRRERG